MIGRVISGVVLAALGASLVYEIVNRTNPEIIERVKGWLGTEEDFTEPEETPAE
jgi:hypothetical protein